MECASWVTAIATAFYAAVVLVTAVYLCRQWRETRRMREATVLKDAYEYIIKTHEARKIVKEHEDLIRGIDSQEKLLVITNGEPKGVDEAIQDVANCYHYVGFLMKYKLLTDTKAISEEGGQTLIHMHGILCNVIRLRREKNPGYKQYFDYLVNQVQDYMSKRKRDANKT